MFDRVSLWLVRSEPVLGNKMDSADVRYGEVNKTASVSIMVKTDAKYWQDQLHMGYRVVYTPC